MSEDQNIYVIYNILQIIAGFSIYILCLTCLYRLAKSQENNAPTLTNVTKVNVTKVNIGQGSILPI